MEIRLTIPGRPVPAVRMTQRTTWTPQARRSLDYQQIVALVGQSVIHSRPLPWRYVRVNITVYLKVNKDGDLPGNRGDWDNFGKAVCDGLQYGQIFANDRSITAGAVEVEPCATASEERVEVELTERIMKRLLPSGGAVTM